MARYQSYLSAYIEVDKREAEQRTNTTESFERIFPLVVSRYTTHILTLIATVNAGE